MMAMRFDQDGNEDGDDDVILLQTELARFPTWLHKVPRTSMAAAFDELEVGRRLRIIVTSTTVIFFITKRITSINIVVQQPHHKVLGRHMEAGHLFLARQVDLHSSSPVQRPIFVCGRNCTFRFLSWLFCKLRFWIFYNFCQNIFSRTAYMHRVTAPNRLFLFVFSWSSYTWFFVLTSRIIWLWVSVAQMKNICRLVRLHSSGLVYDSQRLTVIVLRIRKIMRRWWEESRGSIVNPERPEIIISKVDSACKMDLRKFPMDTQECEVHKYTKT